MLDTISDGRKCGTLHGVLLQSRFCLVEVGLAHERSYSLWGARDSGTLEMRLSGVRIKHVPTVVWLREERKPMYSENGGEVYICLTTYTLTTPNPQALTAAHRVFKYLGRFPHAFLKRMERRGGSSGVG